MSTVVDLTKAAQEMSHLREHLTRSGLLEQLQEFARVADPYVRQATRAQRALEPQVEQIGQVVRELAPEVQQAGQLIEQHRGAIEAGLKQAVELRAYVAKVENVWRNLSI